MIIDCVSDLHGFYPQLEGGDLLIVAGDLTANDRHEQYINFYSWLHKQKYKHYIFIAGNHDTLIEKGEVLTNELANTTYLCDSGTEFEGLKIWGSPWTAAFPGMNPDCMAFTINVGCDTQEWLCDKWEQIPIDTDILITHSPALDILDNTANGNRVGSISLHYWFKYVGRPKLHVCGHIHEGYGQAEVFATHDGKMMKSVNASHVNERYKPVNKPIRIEL